MRDNKAHIFMLTSYPGVSYWMLVLFLISVGTILLLQKRYYSSSYGDKDLREFENVLHEKEQFVQQIFDELTTKFAEEESSRVLDSYSAYLTRLAEKEGISLYYFQQGRMVYWTDNSIQLRTLRQPRLRSPVYQTLNSIYVAKNQPTDDGLLYALILVKTEYPFENQYLESSFQDDFKFGPEIEVSREALPEYSEVRNLRGEYLFSLGLENHPKMAASTVAVSLTVFMVAVFALFWFLSFLADASATRKKRSIRLAVSAITFIAVAVAIFFIEFPRIIFEARFFDPGIYASREFPSLGHLWIFALLILLITVQFYWFFNRSRALPDRYRIPAAYLIFIVSTLWFVFFHHVARSLVIDSTISFEAYKLDNLSVFTFAGLLIILMGLTVFCLLTDKALQLLKRPMRLRNFIMLSITGLLVLGPFFFNWAWRVELLTPFYLIGILGAMFYLRTRESRIKFSTFFILISLTAVFSTIDLLDHTSEKLKAQKEIELAKLSSEHDVVAEMLFSEITEQLSHDSLLISRLSYQIIDVDLMVEYLQRTYFSGYLTKYDLRVTLCRPPDSVLIDQPVNEWYPCFTFFEELVGTEGIKIDESEFYFLNNLNGRISYLGAIPYYMKEDEITLFLELNSKIISEELGYPSLLMRENPEIGEPFSYAKYNRGKLITSRGGFNYRLTSDYYTKGRNTFEILKSEGYEHTIFNVDPENSVIVSVPNVSVIDKLISFSYLFALFFALFSIFYLVVSASHLRATVTWDFKNKIQYSVMGVLFLTFLVICTGTVYFIIQQYRIKHQDNLENTMRSLYIELVHKVEFEDNLRNWSSEDYYNLDELLRKFSNVFYTDINLYDDQGMLLATSRSEIYNQQLLGLQMNRKAYEMLSHDDFSAFIHTESIGKMAYQSAYVPLMNNENNFLAYLNLPYFAQPDVLTQEVTNLVVAILNTYVLLLLLILFLSVIIADRITQPLRFLQSRIAQLSLSNKNDKIVYKGRDEIAGLVDEYNHMVDQLVKSAELLAQSERESAWREMAKQIAHEIKNPLTPMKLNVQHLQRMISEGQENIGERVEKVSRTLIEQIDSLTSIANEFSDFAKIPKARNKKINIIEKLQNVADLFENSEGLLIELDLGLKKDLVTVGDPEQFQRVIINLVKNGLQSIPEKREKKIRISLEDGPEETAVITVEDNGKGIPDSIKDKLFQPNFTTKSGGMGMGLAISASIVKAMGGNIWYSTKPDQGTKFFVKVPVG